MIGSSQVARVGARLGAVASQKPLGGVGTHAIMEVLLLIGIGVDELTDGGIVECEDGGDQGLRRLAGTLAAGRGVNGDLWALERAVRESRAIGEDGGPRP